MNTDIDDSLFNFLQAEQMLQRYSNHSHVVIGYVPEDNKSIVDISTRNSNPCSYKFRSDWGVANKNLNHLEQLKAIWDHYEED